MLPKPEIPDEFKLLADSLGFGEGFERTYRKWAVYVVSKDGEICLEKNNTDRFFKSRRFAEEAAERVNFLNLLMWNGSEYVKRKNPQMVAFVREIEVVERVVGSASDSGERGHSKS